ncbi:MAG: glycoside hydrolase family 99-like domain-containing protein [Acidimicrobiales bacterium]
MTSGATYDTRRHRFGEGTDAVTSIAFYLPQYHRIPENDEWWGEGFTDWTNVRAATPLFPGHHQPHEPGDLGYYDLTDGRVRDAQAELARSYGIGAFCYYHYWFAGRRLLERPFDEVLASGRPDFPLLLCWANEPWTRAWDGSRDQILVDQRYSEEDDARHVDWLIDAFRDPRYLRVDGRPVFLVYRAGQLPDPLRTTATWRARAARAGLPGLFLCRVESHRERGDPAPLGFDAAVDFQPAAGDVPLLSKERLRPRRVLARAGVTPPETSYIAMEYEDLVRRMLSRPQPEFLRFPCVTPDWDNSPRRRAGAFLLTGSTPARFGRWTAEVAERLRGADPTQPRLLFVNGWNEWAEGCHLEPCRRWGYGYLEAFAKAVLS